METAPIPTTRELSYALGYMKTEFRTVLEPTDTLAQDLLKLLGDQTLLSSLGLNQQNVKTGVRHLRPTIGNELRFQAYTGTFEQAESIRDEDWLHRAERPANIQFIHKMQELRETRTEIIQGLQTFSDEYQQFKQFWSKDRWRTPDAQNETLLGRVRSSLFSTPLGRAIDSLTQESRGGAPATDRATLESCENKLNHFIQNVLPALKDSLSLSVSELRTHPYLVNVHDPVSYDQSQAQQPSQGLAFAPQRRHDSSQSGDTSVVIGGRSRSVSPRRH